MHRIAVSGLTLILFCFIWVPVFAQENGNSNAEIMLSSNEGYTSILSMKDGFLATGTDGRIDWISNSKTTTNTQKIPGKQLTNIQTWNDFIFVAGNDDSVYVAAQKGHFRAIAGRSKQRIASLAIFKELVVAGTLDGEILIGDEKGFFFEKQLPIKGAICTLSSNDSLCYGATDQGEIIHSTDGTNWSVFDFNAFYTGYYPTCSFNKILVIKDRIALIGKTKDEKPILLFSNQGNVWTERTLNYTDDQGRSRLLEELANDLIYLASVDQFVLACDKGKMMIIPSCSHCNEVYNFGSENLTGIAFNEKTLMLVGSNFTIKLIPLTSNN